MSAKLYCSNNFHFLVDWIRKYYLTLKAILNLIRQNLGEYQSLGHLSSKIIEKLFSRRLVTDFATRARTKIDNRCC